MKTTKLYQNDVYIKEWDAEITKITEKGLYLSSTAFFPEGGGQSCDTGTIAPAGSDGKSLSNVTDVQEDGHEVLHIVDNAEGLKEGDKVHCVLNWERRFDNMQRHCGEHILSGIFYQECGGVNRGFHMGEDYMTIDISLEDEPTNPEASKPEEITFEIAMHCQLLANRVIWSNAPVSVFRFENREEACKMPLRKALAFDEDISIVCVGSPENAADCVACCGTHPDTAGQVGLLKIYKVEKYKNMFRIYFESGSRALADYNRKYDILTGLANSHSSSVEDLPAKIRSTEDKLASAKGELVKLKKILIEGECARLDEVIAASGKVAVYRLEHLNIDDAFNMAKEYMGSDRCRDRLIMLYSAVSTSYVLASQGAIKCGSLVKDYAGFYQGKGGGGDISARAIFSSEEDAALFADLITKHLQ